MAKKAAVQKVVVKAVEAKPEPEDLLKRVTDDIAEWERYYRPYRVKHLDAWKLWNNLRVKQQFVGDFDSFDPMTFQMVEANVDNVYSTRPKVAFAPRNRYQETDTKILQGMWDRTWDDNNTDFYLPIMGREATNIGNMCTFDCWEDSPEGGYAKTEHIPFPDCILDSAARDQFHVTKAGFEKLERMDNLRSAMRYDRTANNGEGAWIPRYKNLDDVPMYGGGDKQLDEEIKAMLAGSTLDENGLKGQVKVTYMIYLDKIIEVANRKIVIYEGPSLYHKDAYEVEVQDQTEEGDKLFDENSAENVPLETMDEAAAAKALTPTTKKIMAPEIKPFIPIAMHTGYKDGALLIAKGDTETFMDTQEDLNDSINMQREDTARNVKNVKIVKKGVVQPDEQEELGRAQSGSIVEITGGVDNVGELIHDSMDAGIQAEINRTKTSIRDTARIAEVVQGLADQTQQTATEINAQVSQATSGFRTKTLNLEAGYYKQRAENWVKMIQIFMPDGDQMVRVNSRYGVEFQLYKPSQYWGLFDVQVTLATNAQAEQEKKARMALALHDRFKGSPYWNQFELEKYVAEKAFPDLDESQLKLMMNANPQNAAIAGGVPGGDAGAAGAMGGAVTPGVPAASLVPAAPMPQPQLEATNAK